MYLPRDLFFKLFILLLHLFQVSLHYLQEVFYDSRRCCLSFIIYIAMTVLIGLLFFFDSVIGFRFYKCWFSLSLSLSIYIYIYICVCIYIFISCSTVNFFAFI